MVLVEPHGGDPFKICVTNRNQSRTCASPNNSMFVSLTRTEVTCPPFACPNSPASRTAATRRERSPSTRIVNCVRRFVSPSSVVSPDGQLLCRISHKKLDWYVHKGLGGDLHFAGMIPSGGEPRPLHGASVLRAEVYGHGRRFRDSSHSHKYRRYLPEKWKSHNNHDNVVLCVRDDIPAITNRSLALFAATSLTTSTVTR